MLKIISAFITLFLCLTSTNGIQVPLRYGNPQPISRARPDSYLSHQVPINPIVDDVPVVDMDFDAPKVNLGALSGDYYTRLSHPLYPRHHLRIKKTKGFCDPSVDSYTGYIDIGAKHLFFYFFESRSPSNDLILWTNGGPGCSSSLGLFMELGPCQILTKADINSPVVNPYSWNNNASIFFIDQPIGVGFSYADYGEHVGRSEEAASDIAAFMVIFLQSFVEFADKNFHMAGESYGGRYLPVFAAEIVDQNRVLAKNGLKQINLKSVMIGNGLTDILSMTPSYYDMGCTNASVEPFLPISTCVRMRRAIPQCVEMMKKECFNRMDDMACLTALEFCGRELEESFFIHTNLNPYDVSKPCDGPIEETLCYPITKYIKEYLDLPKIREVLGVSPKVGNYSGCSNDVGIDFNEHLDSARMTKWYVEGLLERGIKILVYVGTYDWICNHVGNYRWTNSLEWSGHQEFKKEELREWKVDGRVAGLTRSAKGLTYATIFGAGHMVPYDKPQQALEMVNRWLKGEAF